MSKEREILEGLYDLNDKEVFVNLFNHYMKMKEIKGEMVLILNLLDDVYAGDKDKKDFLRSKILDHYNSLPRDTLDFLGEMKEILKEE